MKPKDPLKVKAGRARWMNVSAEDRRKQASLNGIKGAAAFHKKYKLVPRNPLDPSSKA